jgi:hypothetical protein
MQPPSPECRTPSKTTHLPSAGRANYRTRGHTAPTCTRTDVEFLLIWPVAGHATAVEDVCGWLSPRPHVLGRTRSARDELTAGERCASDVKAPCRNRGTSGAGVVEPLLQRRWAFEVGHAGLVLAAAALILSPVGRRPGWPLGSAFTEELILVQLDAAQFRYLDFFPVWSSRDGLGLGKPVLRHYQPTARLRSSQSLSWSLPRSSSWRLLGSAGFGQLPHG